MAHVMMMCKREMVHYTHMRAMRVHVQLGSDWLFIFFLTGSTELFHNLDTQVSLAMAMHVNLSIPSSILSLGSIENVEGKGTPAD